MAESHRIYIITIFSLLILQIVYTQRDPRVSPDNRRNVSTIKGLEVRTNDNLGDFVVNENGFSLYVKTGVPQGVVECYDSCARRWLPAVIKTNQRISISDDLNGELMAGLDRDDGGFQLSYNNLPLYYFIDDKKPGDIKGNGQEGYYLISPRGKPFGDDTPVDTGSDDSTASEETNRVRKSIFMNGAASMRLTPDLYTIDFIFTQSGDTIENAYAAMEKSLRPLLSQLNMINSKNIIIVDTELQHDDTNIYLSYSYRIFTEDSNKLSQVLSVLSSHQTNLTYYLSYSLSTDSFNKAKTNLYQTAVKNAMDNSYSLLDTLTMTIDKDKPIRSITLQAGDFEKINPIFDKAKSSYFPSLFAFNELTLNAKVSVEYNLI